MKTDNPGTVLPDVKLDPAEVPPGVARRTFMMRSAVIGSAAVITGCTMPEKQQAAAASAPPPPVKEPLSAELDVVKRSKGPVMTGGAACRCSRSSWSGSRSRPPATRNCERSEIVWSTPRSRRLSWKRCCRMRCGKKNARVAREEAVKELEASSRKVLAIEDQILENENLLKRQKEELKALQSKATDRTLEKPAAGLPDHSKLRDEIRRMKELLQTKESAFTQSERALGDKIDSLETELGAKEKGITELNSDLDQHKARLAKAVATERETESVEAFMGSRVHDALEELYRDLMRVDRLNTLGEILCQRGPAHHDGRYPRKKHL